MYQKYESKSGSNKKGACGLYIKNTSPYILRTDLNIRHKSQSSEFETCWVELIHPANNIILGAVYQHPKEKDKFF